MTKIAIIISCSLAISTTAFAQDLRRLNSIVEVIRKVEWKGYSIKKQYLDEFAIKIKRYEDANHEHFSKDQIKKLTKNELRNLHFYSRYCEQFLLNRRRF